MSKIKITFSNEKIKNDLPKKKKKSFILEILDTLYYIIHSLVPIYVSNFF